MGKKLRIAGATVNQTPIDWDNNLRNITEGIREARQKNADLLCFPELCITGYGCEDLFLSDWVAAKAWIQVQQLLYHSHDLTVCVGLPVRINDNTYNGACVMQNGAVTGISLKQNLPGDGVHYEPRWFSPWKPGEVKDIKIGDDPVVVGDLTYQCKGVSFAFEICEDAWRQKRPAQWHHKRGVELILNPSASHFAFGKSAVREKLIVNSSKEFNCGYLFVNQLGNEAGRLIYDGDILIAMNGFLFERSPRLSFKNSILLFADVDFENKNRVSPSSPDHSAEKNEEFAQAASLALYDYLRKSKARGFVLSLSGGADSATCAVLVAEMVRRASTELGWQLFWEKIGENGSNWPTSVEVAVQKILACAYQSTENSSPTTKDAASTLAASIGAKFYSWSVDEEAKSFLSKIEKALGKKLSWADDDIALQNIQARARSPIIWLLANMNRSILLTTSNRSEGDVGYATMDGDTSGSLAPIAGVDKPFIIQWLRWAEKSLGYRGLKPVNDLQPTAELRPLAMSQTDEKDLMPYDILLRIETLAIRDRQSPVSIYEILTQEITDKESLKNYIAKFFRLWAANQWKRERLAPSFHYDDFNVDPRSWCRFPILSGSFVQDLDELARQ